MIYSGKETQTVSNGHNNGAAPAITPVFNDEAMYSGESTPETPASPESIPVSLSPNVYYNPRLDPKNFLEGPLSFNPATRLRQMLARPGIVVSILLIKLCNIYSYLR